MNTATAVWINSSTTMSTNTLGVRATSILEMDEMRRKPMKWTADTSRQGKSPLEWKRSVEKPCSLWNYTRQNNTQNKRNNNQRLQSLSIVTRAKVMVEDRRQRRNCFGWPSKPESHLMLRQQWTKRYVNFVKDYVYDSHCVQPVFPTTNRRQYTE